MPELSILDIQRKFMVSENARSDFKRIAKMCMEVARTGLLPLPTKVQDPQHAYAGTGDPGAAYPPLPKEFTAEDMHYAGMMLLSEYQRLSALMAEHGVPEEIISGARPALN